MTVPTPVSEDVGAEGDGGNSGTGTRTVETRLRSDGTCESGPSVESGHPSPHRPGETVCPSSSTRPGRTPG